MVCIALYDEVCCRLFGVTFVYKNKWFSHKPEGMSSSWKEVLKHLLETYAIEDVIAETAIDMQNLMMSSNMTLNDHEEALWTKALICSQLYTE